MTALFIVPVIPLVESEIALSLKFEFVSCSWAELDVINAVAADWRDNKWLDKRDEIRLMRASSSVIGDDDDRVDERKGCCTEILVGVRNSISIGSDCGDISNDIDDGRSELEPASSVAESGELLACYIERKKKYTICLIKLFFEIMQLYFNGTGRMNDRTN
jgi:UDP-N-acetylmuramyl tripeptide synthase